MKHSKLIIRSAVVLAVVTVLVVLGLSQLNRRLKNYVLNPYRVESTGDMLIAFMEKHDRWPADWKELELFIASEGLKPYGGETVGELQEHVTIDFTFDPKSVIQAPDSASSGQGLKLVVAKDGTTQGATHDPNATIYEYLKRQRQR